MSPLTETSPSNTALPTTVTVDPSCVAPVAVKVPPMEAFVATSRSPETDTSLSNTPTPATVTVPPT